jgi:uncharacterized cupin superfamily protein
MKIINVSDMPWSKRASPNGKFGSSEKELSVALGRDPKSLNLRKRHPFDVEIRSIPPGFAVCPFHSHSAQWEFYHVISGKGHVRSNEGIHDIKEGDFMMFEPGDPHQLLNNGTEPMVVYIVADNPVGESCYYPDSKKWMVRSPERLLIRSEGLDYFDGEE